MTNLSPGRWKDEWQMVHDLDGMFERREEAGSRLDINLIKYKVI